MTFRGFPVEAITFYEQLEADNSRAFWQANKGRYDELVKQPMLDLVRRARPTTGRSTCSARTTTCGSPRTSRRTRPQQGAYGESEGGAGFYVQFSALGLMAGAGYYAMAADQLARFRAAVDAEATGTELAGTGGRRGPSRLPDGRDRRAEDGAARATRRTTRGSSCCVARG